MAWNSRKPWNGWNKWRGRKSPRSRGKISVKRLPSTVARKRSDWVWFYNDTGAFDPTINQGCAIRCIDFGTDYCEEPSIRIPILPEAAVAALYDDDITIAKMVGFINMKPRWHIPSPCDGDEWTQRMTGETWPIYMKAGLYKQELTAQQAGIPPFVNPNIGEDWTDVSALKRWQHIWQPRGRHSLTYRQPDDFIGVCSNVQKNSVTVPNWTMASGSGTWAGYTEPAISTTCSGVTVNDEVETCVLSHINIEREEHAWYRMSLNRRTPIRLHENDSLDIFMNFAIPRPNADCDVLCTPITDGVNPCAMQMSIQLAMKLEYG